MFKKIFIIFTIGVFLGGFAYYLADSLSPFDSAKIQELIEAKEIEDGDFDSLNKEINKLIEEGFVFDYLSSNAYLTFGIFLGSIFCLIASFHLSIDKMFFKKFFEAASMFDALRRAGFVVLGIFLVVYLKLYGADKYTLLSIPLVIILLEIFVVMNLRESIYKKIKQWRNTNLES